MRTWFIVVALALALLPLVVAVGCGGGGEEGESLAAMDRPALEALLKRVTLRVEDLPSGFALQSEEFTDNEQAAEFDPEGREAALARFGEWGRLLGYQATHMTNDPLGTFLSGGNALITVAINIFRTSEGAAAAMEWGRQLVAEPGRMMGLFPGVISLEGEPLSFPTIGDETLAARLTGVFRPQDAQIEVDVDFVAHLVAIRRGPATAHILVAAIGGATPGQEVEDIIRTLDERLGQALR